MPYGPNFPPHGADLISAEFRNQFHGLKDLIDAGPPTDVVGGVPKLVPRNLFLFKAASPTQNLVDGNPDTYQSAGDGTTTGFEYSVDLGSPADITTIKIAGAPYAESSFTDVTVDLRHSDDGAVWTVIAPLLIHPDDATLQALTFPSVGPHRYWGFIVTGYAIPGYHAPFSEMQGFDGVTAVLAPAATVEVQAAAAADATAKADAASVAAQNASTSYTVSVVPRTWRGPWQNGPFYTYGDAVTSNGGLFVCIGESQGQPPENYVVPDGPWQLLAGVQGYVEAASSNNTNAVATLDTPFADPDTEALRQKMNEILLAARR